MIQNIAPALRVVLYEGAGSQPLAAAERLEIMRSLLQKGYQVTRVLKDGAVSSIQEGLLLVLGRFTASRRGSWRPARACRSSGRCALPTGRDSSRFR